MAKITIEELSNSLKEYLNGLGLTEAQVQELIDKMQEEVIGNKAELATSDKSNIVAAINELFQNANNGKQLIADAIGEPLSAEDTFSAMSTDIQGLLSTFKTNMMNNGVTVESTDKFKSLIDKIATLADNEGKGIQYAEGVIESAASITRAFTTADGGLRSQNYAVIPDLPFTPDIVLLFIYDSLASNTWLSVLSYDEIFETKTVKVGQFLGDLNSSSYTYHFQANSNVLLSNGSIYMPIWGNKEGLTFKYYAIGVGEEDTTLRDSLAGILQEEGVSVTEEDDMASLISKVDEEFGRQVVPAGTAVATDVLTGKTFINSTGSTITGTMANRGGAQTITPGTSNKTLNSGYYSGNITVKGDSNLKAENIVSGKSIFGVSGTAAALPAGSNIIYDAGTLNTDLIGGFEHHVYESEAMSSELLYYDDCISITSNNDAGPLNPSCYLLSQYPIKAYPYTKLRISYKTRASEESDYYQHFFSVDFVNFVATGDYLGNYDMSSIQTTGLYGIGVSDYTEVKTIDIDITNNLIPFFLMIKGQHIRSYIKNLHLYIYKIELI